MRIPQLFKPSLVLRCRSVPDSITATFAALADDTRRRLLDQLSNGPMTATQLSDSYDMSRQAVVKHLTALADGGLVQAERSGREVFYSVVPNQLDSAAQWLQRTGAKWDKRLSMLERKLKS